MKNSITNLFGKIRLLSQEDAQDIVEYALLVALIAFAVTAGLRNVATSITTAFNNLNSTFTAAETQHS